MKIRYDLEADGLLLVLRNNPPVDVIEEPGGYRRLWRGWRAGRCRVPERLCARVDFARRN
jgi:hypothetical protein